MNISLFLILLSIHLISPQVIYQPEEFIEKLRSIPVNETLLSLAVENTANFLKHYIYYNISSNPPQPDFNDSYFNKLDLPNLFKDIKIKDTNYFDFQNEFLKKIFSLNDLHTRPYFYLLPINQYYYICPVNLSTYYDNKTNTPKMYASYSVSENNYAYFRNYKDVYNKITKNLNIPIRTINGKSPFDFIQNFADINLRNKHATYTFKQALYNRNNFYIPVTLKDLCNFTIEYENDDIFETDYVIADFSNQSQSDSIKFYQNPEDNNKFISYINNIFSKKTNEIYSKDNLLSSDDNLIKGLDEIFIEFEQKYNIKNHNIFLSPTNKNDNEEKIEWTYEYKGSATGITYFQCRVDIKNKVNVYKILNFGSVYDSEKSLDIAEKCTLLFDENDYPIIIILPLNGGGNPILGYNIIELANPYILTRNSLRIKKDDKIKEFINLYNANELFVELNSSKLINGDYIEDDFIIEKYGDKITEFSKPFSWNVNQKRIEEIKSKLKHKRKPTEIITISDSYSLSAASFFLKNIYKAGIGITVGFNGNPEISDDLFDISTSASAVLGMNGYYYLYPDEVLKMAEYKIGINSLTCIASYHDYQESHIPQEYDIQIADARIKIYNPYTDDDYQKFIDESLPIFEYYKDNCNPNHTMLILFSDECKFSNHLHGGYKCGSNGKWNKSDCISVYCDNGYYYNQKNNSCIKYPIDEDEKTDEPYKSDDTDKTDEPYKSDETDITVETDKADTTDGSDISDSTDTTHESDTSDSADTTHESDTSDSADTTHESDTSDRTDKTDTTDSHATDGVNKKNDTALIIGSIVGGVALIAIIIFLVLFFKKIACFKPKEIDTLLETAEEEKEKEGGQEIPLLDK